MNEYYETLKSSSAEVLSIVVESIRIMSRLTQADMLDLIEKAERLHSADADVLALLIADPGGGDNEPVTRAARDFCRSYKKALDNGTEKERD